MEKQIPFLNDARDYIIKYGSVDLAMDEIKKKANEYPPVGCRRIEIAINQFICRETLYRLDQIKKGIFSETKFD